jgi:glycosyltransferase involved in cell wall biosynthesis
MKKDLKKLIVFTAGFPFGKSEPFLKTELKYLCQHFDQITLISVNPESKICDELPKKCALKILRHKETLIEKTYAILNIFNSIFWTELWVIKHTYQKKINLSIIATMLMGLYRANTIKKFVLKNFDFSNDPNTLLYSYWCDDSALGLALLQNKYQNIKTCSRIHGWDVYFEANPINYLSYRHFITQQLKAIFSISEQGKNYCENHWKINNCSKIKVSRLGVVSQNFLKLTEENIIVSCSNMIPLKRVELIINALSKLKHIPIKWVHFGEGPEFKRIEKLCNETLTSNITWELKGWVKNSDVLQWYESNKPSLFINVSSSEGIPVSIMEAISFGIPLIATDVGGTSEIVNNENGYLISKKTTIEEVKSLICDYLTLTDYEKILKKNAAYKTWKNSYNAEINYTEFCNLITKL